VPFETHAKSSPLLGFDHQRLGQKIIAFPSEYLKWIVLRQVLLFTAPGDVPSLKTDPFSPPLFLAVWFFHIGCVRRGLKFVHSTFFHWIFLLLFPCLMSTSEPFIVPELCPWVHLGRPCPFLAQSHPLAFSLHHTLVFPTRGADSFPPFCLFNCKKGFLSNFLFLPKVFPCQVSNLSPMGHVNFSE